MSSTAAPSSGSLMLQQPSVTARRAPRLRKAHHASPNPPVSTRQQTYYITKTMLQERLPPILAAQPLPRPRSGRQRRKKRRKKRRKRRKKRRKANCEHSVGAGPNVPRAGQCRAAAGLPVLQSAKLASRLSLVHYACSTCWDRCRNRCSDPSVRMGTRDALLAALRCARSSRKGGPW